MAKEVKARVKMLLPGGGATPAPPVGSCLGQHQVKLMDFCKAFNAKTSSKKGEIIPVHVTIYKDKSFDFVIKTPPASALIKKKIKLKKGSSNPGTEQAGVIKMSDLREIAKIKMEDLNAHDLDAATKIIAGSARSMGLKVEK